MYLLVSRYTAPRERVEELVPAHREYLRRHFEAGHFVVSGRRVPWDGGVVVARGLSREELDAVIAEDPFAQADAAETEVVAFEPLFAAPGLGQLLETL
jgi:uncharacterized protein YciI